MSRRAPPHRPPRLPTPPRPDGRPSAAARGYDGRWQRLRKMVLAGEPLCRECRRQGRLVSAEHVDHVIPLARGGTNDMVNLQPLCASCHSKKTAAEDGGFGGARRG